jgi:bacillithiol biosynthesis cysteine-adding enzyme BshC
MPTKIPFSVSNHLSPLVLDYLNEKNELKELYNLPQKLESFEEAINKHHFTNRTILVAELLKQNKVASDNIINNIKLLENDNTFTVTTGHQICLFTGPLYFIYKIISTINLAKELKSKYPAYNFVPVYWMATEDHDFEEINHIHLFGKKITWETEQTGAVGRFKLTGIEDFIEKVKAKFSTPTDLLNKFISHYENASNLTEATRNLVNDLFKNEGLVTVDADNKELKKLATPIFKDELLNSTSHDLINDTSKKIEALGNKTQVTPREINLFYLKENIRERLEYKNDKFEVLNTEISFTKDEILNELNENPERFSPNVALRPLYQELILPNLANIGGPGETAYWLQLKSSFNHFKVSFPILVLRNSVLLINKNINKKIDKLNLSFSDVFTDEHELIKDYIKEVSDVTFDNEINEIEKVFELAKDKATKIDFSLEKTVIAELTKAQNAINMIQGKTIKAEKRNNEIAVNQIISIKETLFPNNSFQERVDNILNHNSETLIEDLLANIVPFDNNVLVLNLN